MIAVEVVLVVQVVMVVQVVSMVSVAVSSVVLPSSDYWDSGEGHLMEVAIPLPMAYLFRQRIQIKSWIKMMNLKTLINIIIQLNYKIIKKSI